jgi:hypothetical protein
MQPRDIVHFHDGLGIGNGPMATSHQSIGAAQTALTLVWNGTRGIDLLQLMSINIDVTV